MNRIVVSTEDDEIASVSRALGAEVPFLRPAALATDAASSIDVVLHALDELEARDDYRPTVVALLQPTSPLRTWRHLVEAFSAFKAEAGAIVSVQDCKPPSWTYRLDATGRVAPAITDESLAPRLATTDRYVMPNGAIYVARTPYLRANRGFEGPGTFAYRMDASSSIDIDVEEDFALAERIGRTRPT